jgi:hypothetical protein
MFANNRELTFNYVFVHNVSQRTLFQRYFSCNINVVQLILFITCRSIKKVAHADDAQS